MVLTWYDAKKGPLVMPIGDARAVRPDTKVYQVAGEYAVAVLMATKQLLDDGNEAGAYSCLTRWLTKTMGGTDTMLTRGKLQSINYHKQIWMITSMIE